MQDYLTRLAYYASIIMSIIGGKSIKHIMPAYNNRHNCKLPDDNPQTLYKMHALHRLGLWDFSESVVTISVDTYTYVCELLMCTI